MEFDKKPVKILLVDDREDNLFSMQTLLEKDGYVLTKARSGNEALKVLLKEVDFTLILMDVQMPGINGFETAALIYERDKLKHIPIIFVTAHDHTDETIFQGYRAGAVDYIYKPINPELLRAKVAVFAELYRKNHLLREHEMQLQQMNSDLEERVRKRTEEIIGKNAELELINNQLKKVNNDLDNFVYAASHDLKAPVSNIEGLLSTLTEMIGEQIDNDENVKYVFDLIGQSIQRFKNTILDLTEITKIQKESEEDLDAVVISEVIHDVLLDIKSLINSTDACVQIMGDPLAEVFFSRKNIKSILYNLISNAIKYRSPERRPDVRVQYNIVNDKVYLSVVDNGLGFNNAEKEKLFGMFKRLHSHVEGSGIGLYIVKRILDNSGGYIEADGVPGQGSTFNICLANQKVL